MPATKSNIINFNEALTAKAAAETAPPPPRDPNAFLQKDKISIMQMRAEIAGAMDNCDAPLDRITEGIMDEVLTGLACYYGTPELALKQVTFFARQMATWIRENDLHYPPLDEDELGFV